MLQIDQKDYGHFSINIIYKLVYHPLYYVVVVECKFKDHWGSIYVMVLTICDALVLIAIFITNYQLAYPWLIIMKMTLIGELCFIIKMYSKNRCKPSAAHLFNFVS
ncbi:uncharacterized protein LOC112683725 [Sipha flava]|uniref:Uncharacterized protein LOC112683725 n=1 Tax=Sipha flava TaxID=143950 RepID=A0A8B8FK05_9HEMI|nr:uncharacterized protein LOC112683725 [Sipha flava]